MKNKESLGRSIPLAALAGFSAVVLAAGCGTALWTLKSAQSPTTTTKPTTSMNSAMVPAPNSATSPLPQSFQNVPSPSVQPSEQNVAQIYWVKDTGNHLDLVASPRTLKRTQKPNAILDEAFKSLLAGPTDPQFTSTIPKGTKLRSVKVKENGVHVDLSKDFTTGGGSASMTARLAQVLYTASSLNPDAKVWIDVDGKKLEVLGGEGLELDQPMTRSNFQKNFQL